jgi:hypothetical protein
MEYNEREHLENQVKEESKSALEMIIREGARRMLQAAIENEAAEYIDRFKHERDFHGYRLVVRKELVSVLDGYRESKQSRQEMLRDLKQRGLKKAPKPAVGDGGLGFWAALPEEFPETREQRCWVHKTANILDKMPKSVHGRAKVQIRNMYMAPTKEEAMKAYDHFLSQYSVKYERACECLKKKIKGHHLIGKVIEGIKFVDGEQREIKQEAA